jgi:DNA-binding beta-propeller fold protein YncE
MWWRALAAVAVLGAGVAAPAAAQTLYAASFRTTAIGGASDGIAGSLYTVNLGTGAATFVAPIRVNGTMPIGVTGIAVHPETGQFYGITSPQSPNFPQSLVMLDVATGRADVVGDLKYPSSDIAFNRAGILFAWLQGTSQLGIINLTSGAITPIGPSRQAGSPSGLAIDPNGTAYITTGGAGGTLDTVDLGTGTVTKGPLMAGAPFPTGVNSMTFSPSGLLLAVNSNGGAPAVTRLVTINTATGAVSPIGTLPDDTDALTFAPDLRHGSLSRISVQTLALMVLGVIALILGLIGWFVGRKPTAH